MLCTAYCDSKDLAKRTASDVLKDRACETAIKPKHYVHQRGLASMVYKFRYKKTGSEATSSVYQELAQEFNKPVIKKFKRRKVLKILLGQHV